MERKPNLHQRLVKFEKSIRSTNVVDTQQTITEYCKLNLRKNLELLMSCSDSEEMLRLQGAVRILNSFYVVLNNSPCNLEETTNG